MLHQVVKEGTAPSSLPPSSKSQEAVGNSDTSSEASKSVTAHEKNDKVNEGNSADAAGAPGYLGEGDEGFKGGSYENIAQGKPFIPANATRLSYAI